MTNTIPAEFGQNLLNWKPGYQMLIAKQQMTLNISKCWFIKKHFTTKYFSLKSIGNLSLLLLSIAGVFWTFHVVWKFVDNKFRLFILNNFNFEFGHGKDFHLFPHLISKFSEKKPKIREWRFFDIFCEI